MKIKENTIFEIEGVLFKWEKRGKSFLLKCWSPKMSDEYNFYTQNVPGKEDLKNKGFWKRKQ